MPATKNPKSDCLVEANASHNEAIKRYLMIRGLGGSAVKAIYIIKRDRPPNKPPKADCLDEANAFHQHIQKRRDILDVRTV